MMAFVEDLDGVVYDGVNGGTAVSTLVAVGTLTLIEAATIAKGTLLKGALDAYTVCASAETACAILAETLEATDAGEFTVPVYIKGIFNRNNLVVDDDDTVDAHEDELRDVGIFLTADVE